MPLSGKKKKGKKRKRILEETRLRKKLDKTDTQAIKYIASLDHYLNIIQSKLLPWFSDNEKLVLTYFESLPKEFDYSLLEDYFISVMSKKENQPVTTDVKPEEDNVSQKAETKVYSTMSTVHSGFRDLGAPFTEMDTHIMCRIIQNATSVLMEEEEAELQDDKTKEEEKSNISKSPSKLSESKIKTSLMATDDSNPPPTLTTHPEQFQDLIVDLSDSLKVLHTEELEVWKMMKFGLIDRPKTKENIGWIKDLLRRRKIAEEKKKKKRRKKKRPKPSSAHTFERCKTCSLILTDTYTGPKPSEYNYVVVHCKYARREHFPRHPLHVAVHAKLHWLFAQVAKDILEQTDLATNDIRLYHELPIFVAGSDTKTINAVNPIALDGSLNDSFDDNENLSSGGSRFKPFDLTLYYDFRQPDVATACPLLNSDIIPLADTGDTLASVDAYKERNLEYQLNYAKNFVREREKLSNRHKQDTKSATESSEGESDDSDSSSS